MSIHGEASLPFLVSLWLLRQALLTARLWQHSLEIGNTWVHVHFFFCGKVSVCIFPIRLSTFFFFTIHVLPFSSFLNVCLCVVWKLFTSGTLHHYFPILHVACWVSSRCQLPAACWLMHSPLSQNLHSNCSVIVCPVMQHAKTCSFIISVDSSWNNTP